MGATNITKAINLKKELGINPIIIIAKKMYAI